MSVKEVKKQIVYFLERPTPEVLVIKGQWGTGKTHTWNQTILENKNKISLDKYVYVSLFGVDSIDKLKSMLFDNILKKENIGNIITPENFDKNLSTLLGIGVKNSIRNVPIVRSFSGVYDSLTFISIRDVIICIDDIERRNQKLDIKDIFGLISIMKEQKDCKVVLLLNESKLGSDAAVAEYSTYKEKISDLELSFSPTIAESMEIVFDKTCKYYTTIVSCSEKLNIVNVRVIKKIKNYLMPLEPFFEKYEYELVETIISNLVLFVWCHARTDDNIPTLEYMRYFNNNKNKEIIDSYAKNNVLWKTILGSYNYNITNELGEVMLDYVNNGYLDGDAFYKISSDLDVSIKYSVLTNEYLDSWGLVYNSFKENQDEVVESLVRNFLKVIDKINLSNLNDVVFFLSSLEKDKEANSLIDKYFESADENKLNAILNQYNFFKNNSFDSLLIQKIDEIKSQNSVKVEIIKTIEKIVEKSGWASEDELFLSQTNYEEYYTFFKKLDTERLRSYINNLLLFGRMQGASNVHKRISENATKALRMIANESTLNKIRVKAFNVDLDEESAS